MVAFMNAKTKTTRSRTKWFDSLFGIETALKKATLQLYGFHRMAEIVTSLIDLYAHIYIHGKIYFVIWKDDFKILRSLEEVDFVHQCKCIKIKGIGVQFSSCFCVRPSSFPKTPDRGHPPQPWLVRSQRTLPRMFRPL